MNLQQLEYIIAVDTHRHFVTAANKCFVTQATLSMMIKKLEEELDIKIFDRSKQPVKPTKEGELVIQLARQILLQSAFLKDYAKDLRGEINGELRLGIIPTLAPYILPLFIKSFSEKYPHLKIFIKEMVTDDIVSKIKTGDLDVGLLSIPLHDVQLTEILLFYEEFFAYASETENLSPKKYLLPKEMDMNHLWLMEEGHCLRNQVFNFCELTKLKSENNNVHYEAGSIETLINLVDKHRGITIIPELAILNLNSNQKKNIREFASPKPAREIGLVMNKSFSRKAIIEKLKEEIINNMPAEMFAKNKACRAENPSDCYHCESDCRYPSNILSLNPIKN